MRFTVIGTDAAGLAMEFTLEARCADEAEHLARQRGVNVVSVRLGGRAGHAATVAAPPGAHAPAAATPQVRASAPTPPRRSNVPPAQRVNFGLVSIALALTALMFCWIPTVGLISLPLCVVGLVAGSAGLIAAAVSRGGSRLYPAQRRPGRLIAPTGGLALSGIALALTVMIARGPTSDAEEPPAPIRLATGGGDAAETPQQGRDKPLTIVVSGTDRDTPRPLGAEPARASAPTTPVEVDLTPQRLGPAEVSIESCTVGEVPLVGEQGRSAGITRSAMLVVRVSVKNISSAAFVYQTMAGDDAGLLDAAVLRDDRGVILRRARFGFAIVPAGRIASERVEPGRGLIDVLVFERPAAAPRGLSLTIPGRCVGTAGMVTLPVPVPAMR